VPVLWKTKTTVQRHLISQKHLTQMESAARAAVNQPSIVADSGNPLVLDWVRTLVISNTPFNRSTRFKPFLQTYTEGAGKIPAPQMLFRTYLPAIAKDVMNRLIIPRVEGRRVCVEIDETPDALGRKVFNVIIHADGTPLLVHTQHVAIADAKTVNGIIISVLGKLGIVPENVIALIADGVSYNDSAFNGLISVCCHRAFRVWCCAHILHLVGETITAHKKIQPIVEWMNAARALFLNSSAAKGRWLQYQTRSGVNNPTKLPNWSESRWRTWMSAVQWMTFKMDDFKDFVEEEHDYRVGDERCQWYGKIAEHSQQDENYWAQFKFE
jgi:hypothetical protein